MGAPTGRIHEPGLSVALAATISDHWRLVSVGRRALIRWAPRAQAKALVCVCRQYSWALVASSIATRCRQPGPCLASGPEVAARVGLVAVLRCDLWACAAAVRVCVCVCHRGGRKCLGDEPAATWGEVVGVDGRHRK